MIKGLVESTGAVLATYVFGGTAKLERLALSKIPKRK